MLSFAKGWRTVAFNVVMAVVMIASLVSGQSIEVDSEQVRTAIDNVDIAIAAVWSLVAVILRVFTNTPIGTS